MKELLIEILSNFWLLLNSIAFFILLGVLIAGIFKLLLPDAFIRKHLGQHNFMANIKAAVLGIPLPLCSCSVLPFVSALKKSGASKSAIQTFLISTPITGADSIMASYGVFGWLFTTYRVLTSVIISMLAGLLTLFLIKDESLQPKRDEKLLDTNPTVKDKYNPRQLKVAKQLDYSIKNFAGAKLSFADTQKNALVNKENRMSIFKKILSYSLDTIYKDFSLSLIIGIFLGALIVTFMPENLAEYISSNQLLNYFLVLAVSIPLYVCATASIPLGLSLLTAGFSPGAAFIFLTAGPATNTITMSVVLKTMGKGSLAIYLLSVIFGSILFGFLFDLFLPDSLEQMLIVDEHDEEAGIIAQVSSIIILLLSLKYSLNKNSKLIKVDACDGASACCN